MQNKAWCDACGKETNRSSRGKCRSCAMRRANASRTPEQRREICRKARAAIPPERRREIGRKNVLAFTYEQRRKGGLARRTHGMKGTPTYITWVGMKQRCLNPNAPNYSRYGGRGITVCDRWRDSFEAFYADLGARPEGTTLHRLDGDGHYEPGNVVWADAPTQNREAWARRKAVAV